MMTVDEAMNHAQNELECAFEKWLTDECPSGDCESVERQWDESFVHHELVDELRPVMALTWEVRRLRGAFAKVAAKVIKMDIEHAWAIGEAKRLTEENDRLRKEVEEKRTDAERLDELDTIAQREEGADMHLAHGHIALYLRTGIGSNAHGVRGSDIRKVIDAARGAK